MQVIDVRVENFPHLKQADRVDGSRQSFKGICDAMTAYCSLEVEGGPATIQPLFGESHVFLGGYNVETRQFVQPGNDLSITDSCARCRIMIRRTTPPVA